MTHGPVLVKSQGDSEELDSFSDCWRITCSSLVSTDLSSSIDSREHPQHKAEIYIHIVDIDKWFGPQSEEKK